MYRFTRRGTVKNASVIPQAIGWATELNGYVNGKYNVELTFGLEMFNNMAMTWYVDFENMADIEAFNTALMTDQDYWAQVAIAKDFWVDGSLEDRVVRIIG